MSRYPYINLDSTIGLRGGSYMPLIGLGTYRIEGYQSIKDILDHAFTAGYRLIDTSPMYGNEEDIGRALKELLQKHDLRRWQIFITTKLLPCDQGERAYRALEKSLKNLDCEYIDLYLIQWPGAYSGGALSDSELRDQSWQQLVKGVKNGLTKSIGVSNYNVSHLRELVANDHGIKPAVNQVECHPYYRQAELLDFCKEENINVQAYSSLGGTGNKDLLSNPQVKKISSKLKKNPAQVLLRWAIQQNMTVIPKTRSKMHLKENLDLDFNIPEKYMKILDSFSQRKYEWDPDTIR